MENNRPWERSHASKSDKNRLGGRTAAGLAVATVLAMLAGLAAPASATT